MLRGCFASRIFLFHCGSCSKLVLVPKMKDREEEEEEDIFHMKDEEEDDDDDDD